MRSGAKEGDPPDAVRGADGSPVSRKARWMNGHIDLTAIVLLALGGCITFVAWRHPNLGAALLVGTGVITFLYMLMM